MNINLIDFFQIGDKIVKNRQYVFKDLNVTTAGTTQSDLDIKAIKNSLQNIFTWKKGERILNPEFGNTMYEYLYEPIDSILYENLKNEIKKMINTYEPRIRIDDISIDESANSVDNNSITVKIIYSIPDLNISSQIETFSIAKQ